MGRSRRAGLLLWALATLAACTARDEPPIVVQLTLRPEPTEASVAGASPTPFLPRPLPALRPTSEPTPSHEGWLTYRNEAYRYQFRFPPDATVREAQPEDFDPLPSVRDSEYAQYTGQLCVTIESRYSFIAIAAPPNDSANVLGCGETHFAPYDVVSLQGHLTVGGRTYTSQGYEFRGPGESLDQHFEFHILRFADSTTITYGSRSDQGGTFADYLAEKSTLFQVIQSIQPVEVASVPRLDFANLPLISEPLVTGSGFYIDSWSPDGSVLLYSRGWWTDDYQQYQTEYHFHNVRTGKQCTYSPEDEANLNVGGEHFWLHDGRFLTFNIQGELGVLSSPCSLDFMPLAALFPEPILGVGTASADRRVLLLRGQSSYWLYEPETHNLLRVNGLPSGEFYYAIFSPNAAFFLMYYGSGEIYLLNAATGEVVGVIQGDDAFYWQQVEPRWISDDELILNFHRMGPQLVTVAPEGIRQIQPVASSFFGLADHPGYLAYGVGDGDGFHLVLSAQDSVSLPRALLYHSEMGTVEELPGQFRYFWGDDFAPGRDALLLRGGKLGDPQGRSETWVRAVDPPGSGPLLFATVDDESNPAFSLGGKLIAVVSSVEYTPAAVVSVYSVPNGSVRARWNLGDYRNFNFSWSHDNSHLAAVGSTSDGREQALFILPMPEK